MKRIKYYCKKVDKLLIIIVAIFMGDICNRNLDDY